MTSNKEDKRELPRLPANLDPDRLEAARNPQPRCACALVLDTSGSMEGEAIYELQEALHAFFTEMADDPVCQLSVEPAVITCGGTAQLARPFTSLLDFDKNSLLLLEADGATPLGAALDLAIDQVLERRRDYRRCGLQAYRPVIVAMTDGQPTDSWERAAARLRALKDHVFLIVVATGPSANMAILNEIAQPERPPLLLSGISFQSLFRLVSDSLRSLTTSSGDVRAATLALQELSR
ncbi:MAG: VWA domain-containing protein [Opitutaceae bacterium]|nr:VWA domain-containing protein [Opitutaceae bacterium]